MSRVKKRKSKRRSMKSTNLKVEDVVLLMLTFVSFFIILPELAKNSGVDPNLLIVLGIFAMTSLILSIIRR